MAIKLRGQVIDQTDSVQLRANFRVNGALSDLDAFPTVTIIQPSGNVVINQTSAGVYHLATGVYGFDYKVGINGSIGVWVDYWQGTADGYTQTAELNFVVMHTDLPATNSDGLVSLGDDPGFNYSQTATQNINKLMKTLKARLNSAGKSMGVDSFGNPTYFDCDVYDVDTLVTFLANSLTLFNEIPTFTYFSFDDVMIIDQFHDVIVQGATIMALNSKALIERGREFAITDNSVSFSPPGVSELLNSEFGAELANHMEKLKMIKSSMKPSPIGLGSMSVMNGANPAVRRLRTLRARQIY
jgi:hypothetical protein